MYTLSRWMTAALVITGLLWLNTSFAKTYPLVNCSQLQAPNAVLLVHASWCPHCRSYLPVYSAVSNLPQMKGYKFYVRRNDQGAQVCGYAIQSVPVTFTNNMHNSAAGELTKGRLIGLVSSS